MSMRLFVAIDLPQDIIARLERLVNRLKPLARLAWSPVENFHITTKFVGEWREDQLAEMQGALDALPPREPFKIAVRGLGFFPNRRQARIFWAGIEAPPALGALAAETDRATSTLGVESEKRAYSPHLTLARNRNGANVDGLLAAVDQMAPPEFGGFSVDRFFLYRSVRSSGGSVYTKLSEHPFSK